MLRGFVTAAAALSIVIILRGRLHRPLPPTLNAEPLARIPDWPILILAGMTVWIGQILGASSTAMLLSLGPDASASLRGTALLMCGGYLGAAVASAFVLGLLPGIGSLIGLQAPPSPRTGLMRGAIALLLAAPIVMTAGWLAAITAELFSGRSPPMIAHKTLELLTAPAPGEQRVWWWLTVSGVILGAPVFEELIYRGFLQTSIRRAFLRAEGRAPARAGWAAIIITSLIFALMHANVAAWHALATLFVLSLAFGIAFERTRSLWTTITMHALFNALNITLATL